MSKQLFTRLKSALKARNMTYADIADRLSVSEITIKRIFSEQDCKLSRLNEICRAADIDLQELIESTSQHIASPSRLSSKQSQALANNRSLLSIFLLLLNRYSPGKIRTIYQLPEHTMYRFLRALEELELIRLEEGLDITLLVPPPIDFLAHHSLDREIREINKAFLAWTFEHRDSPEHQFESVSRHLSQESADTIQQDIAELAVKIRRLAQRDSLLVPESELLGYKLSCAFGLTPFDRLFTVTEQDARDLVPTRSAP